MSSPTSSPSEESIRDESSDSEEEIPRSFLESKVWFAAFAIAGVIVAVTAVILLTRSEAADRGFTYNEIEPPQDVLDFSLTNHRGEQFTLSDHAGETTILTFLYTSCTDVCPFVGAKLRQALDVLGDNADGVNIAVVTLDPRRDTAERVAEYSRSLRMYDDWHYLLGNEDELMPLWDRYFAGQPIIGDQAVFATDQQINDFGLNAGLSDFNERTANATRFDFGGGYDVGHATPVIVIDRNLKIRIVAGQTLDPAEFAADIAAINGEG